MPAAGEVLQHPGCWNHPKTAAGCDASSPQCPGGQGWAHHCFDIPNPKPCLLPEVEPWHLHKSSVSSSAMALFQHAIISIL